MSVVPSASSIMSAVCHEFEISKNALRSARRTYDLITPRHVAIYLCCEMTSLSTVGIGKQLGGRDHTTILHARESIKKRLAKDSTFAKRVEQIRQNVEKGPAHMQKIAELSASLEEREQLREAQKEMAQQTAEEAVELRIRELLKKLLDAVGYGQRREALIEELLLTAASPRFATLAQLQARALGSVYTMAERGANEAVAQEVQRLYAEIPDAGDGGKKTRKRRRFPEIRA